MKLSYTVKKEDNYTNLKELIKTQFHISDRLFLKLKREQKIFLNNINTKLWQPLKANDLIEIYIDFKEDNSNIPSTKMNLDIIYEDDAFLIVNKPAGIPVHPSVQHYDCSLSSGIKYYFDTLSLDKKIRPVNRIDKNTSGIVIFAKNEYIQECLVRQMKNKDILKKYIAVCDGIFSKKQGTITLPISRKEGSIIERCIDEKGSPSITHYLVLNECIKKNYSVLECLLETGRTHQIRVHMMAIGHSLLGDTLYGKKSNLINRQALHAYKVSFIHPITKKRVNYMAPLPYDLLNLINTENKKRL